MEYDLLNLYIITVIIRVNWKKIYALELYSMVQTSHYYQGAMYWNVQQFIDIYVSKQIGFVMKSK